jgi:hypothetical protein
VNTSQKRSSNFYTQGTQMPASVEDLINQLRHVVKICEGEALAYRATDKRGTEAHAYCQKYLMPAALGHNIWHAILDDAIRMRKKIDDIFGLEDREGVGYLLDQIEKMKAAEDFPLLTELRTAIECPERRVPQIYITGAQDNAPAAWLDGFDAGRKSK